MARKALLLATAFVLSLLALTGCNNDNESGGGSFSVDNEESSPTASSSPESSGQDTAAACASASPGSAAQESCEAQGVPGVTESPDRCGSTTPSPIASGIIQGTFGSYCENAIATTYDTSAVPDGADTTITINETDAATTLEMIARGFTPNTEFNVSLHEKLCGASPTDAGEEYEDTRSQESDDLNLDFTTDQGGNSTASVTVPWLLPDDGIGRSLLITLDNDETASPNATDDDKAVACVSLER
ncbi:hypothetical protein MUG94_05035 [Arthrobacter gengyunqii]|uniref:Uncharacterized protein n=1 Tax=Arthrobacter gengyunqii TaxID=2886940 RepID=A0A9X1M1N5_9MICC|nr:hypothetical protein [Arthrobacter gengyunqii]MCC3269673.1 hypothetical protein [Arthrobacter gengyunqii]UOY97131.1 hypothetical protein MUG94_05035 [Arthrobacter gengyunqii]